MLQIIITVLIVAAALGFGIYRTLRSLRDPLRGCDGCDKNCGGCSLEELKKDLEERKQNRNS
jgi:hypothetical protein